MITSDSAKTAQTLLISTNFTANQRSATCSDRMMHPHKDIFREMPLCQVTNDLSLRKYSEGNSRSQYKTLSMENFEQKPIVPVDQCVDCRCSLKGTAFNEGFYQLPTNTLPLVLWMNRNRVENGGSLCETKLTIRQCTHNKADNLTVIIGYQEGRSRIRIQLFVVQNC